MSDAPVPAKPPKATFRQRFSRQALEAATVAFGALTVRSLQSIVNVYFPQSTRTPSIVIGLTIVFFMATVLLGYLLYREEEP
jgi:hypothetical protein